MRANDMRLLTKPIEKRLNTPLLFISLATILLLVLFVILGLNKTKLGFPLDDAWIHQTYARNLVEHGSWSFVPGVVSGGSTSPLWTLLLSPGFLIGGNFYFYWTLSISALLFLGLVIIVCKSYANFIPEPNKIQIIILGLIVGLEWHLQWAAASGMETIAFSCVIVLITFLSTGRDLKWWLIGIASGLLLWIRPDGLTIIGPIAFLILDKLIKKQINAKKLAEFAIPFVLILFGYFLFNYLTTGQVFPNTFYAKQMEYQELLGIPLGERIFTEFSPLWVGVCLFLIPGFLFSMAVSIKKRDLGMLGFPIWVIGYVFLFAVRLPVIYQHGRYIIPVIPLFILFGYWGTANLLAQIIDQRKNRFASVGVLGLLLTISIAFYLQGIKAYQTDLEVIDTFMVQPANWVKENTSPDALIAAHDIGAMGFFAQRNLLDLAGLVNPEVIPFIRDEENIHDYIIEKEAEYFVCFNDWYQHSDEWGEVIKSYIMINGENDKKVEIIKLKY